MIDRLSRCVVLVAACVLPALAHAEDRPVNAAPDNAISTNDTIDAKSVLIDNENVTGPNVRGAEAVQSGQSTGGASDGQRIRRNQSDAGGKPAASMVNGQSGGYLGAAGGTETAQSGQFIGGSDDGQSTRSNQPGPNANRACISECGMQLDLVPATPQEGTQAATGAGKTARSARPGQRPRKGGRQHKPM